MHQLLCRLGVILCTLILTHNAIGQACFEIESILVDACGSPEGQNEMVRFKVGNSPLNAANLNVNWPNSMNSWDGVCQDASTANKIAQINETIVNCGFLKEPTNGVLPANSRVILISSIAFNPANNSFANLSDTLYVIFHCSTETAGNFANAGSGIRTLSMAFSGAGGCNSSVSYDRSQLIGGDGALANFDANGNDTYSNQGCSAPIIIPDPSWTPPAPFCNSANPIDLNTLITGELGGTWEGPGVNGNSFNPAGLEGDIDITYTIGVTGCQTGNASETNTIQVITGGSTNWTSPGSTCSTSDPLNLNDYIIGDLGGTWSGTGVTGNQFNPSGLNGDIEITYTLGSGSCESSSSHIISVELGGAPSWNPQAICSSSSPINLNNFITGDPGGTWAGIGVSGNTFDPNGLVGEIAITYSVDNGSCSAISTQNISIIDAADASWSPTSICNDSDPIDLSTLVTGTNGGTWSGNGINGSLFDPTGLLGNITVTYTVGTGDCVDTKTDDIEVISIPEPPVLSNDTSHCENTPPPTLVAIIDPGASIEWINTSNPESILSTTTSLTPPQNLAGEFGARQILNGCPSNLNTVNVDILESPSTPTFSGEVVVCSDILNEDIVIQSSGNPQWFDDAALTNLVNEGLIYESELLDNTINTLYISVIESNCPSGVLEIPIIREDSLEALILGDDIINACLPEQVILQSSENALNLWSTGETSQMISVNLAGIYKLTRSNSCNSAVDSVEIIDSSVDASFNLFIPEDSFLPVTIQVSNYENGCDWYLQGEPLTLDENNSFIVQEEINYTIEHQCDNSFGCSDKEIKTFNIEIPSEFYVPNAFTPNGDGDNDIFIPKGYKIENMQMLIYNRWGELVFQSDDKDIGWDGKTVGNIYAPDGLYTCLIKAIDIYQNTYELSNSVFLFK